ncbi:MAG TPA: hypothetical protein PKD26_15515 [Pyrinomonadaceae bacterium]|nr:hypothetical protein [Pyrinomonadaceae bacterium]
MTRRKTSPLSTTFSVAIAFVLVNSILAAPGSLDPTFGVGGSVVHNVGNASVRKTILQADGKIVVVGSRKFVPRDPGAPSIDYVLVRRFWTNGVLDTTFASVEGIGHDAEVQPDGKIVVAGTRLNSGRAAPGGSALPAPAVWRFNVNGSIDTTFGEGGVRELPLIAHGSVQIEIFDSRIFIGYAAANPIPGTNFRYRISRLSPDGAVDLTRYPPYQFIVSETAFAIRIDPLNGDIVAAGIDITTGDAVLRRYDKQGDLVASFGERGQASIPDCSRTTAELFPKDVVILQDGKIKVLRFRGSGNTFVVVSLLNQNGWAEPSLCKSNYLPPAVGTTLFVQPDGKFFYYVGMVGGTIRFFADGTEDAIINHIAGHPSAIQPDQKIVAAWAEYPLYHTIRVERRLLD